jgi:hypothetical protein
MQNIVFIADSTYYKNMNAKVCYDLITHIRDYNEKYKIKIFWTDEDPYQTHQQIINISPKLVVFFEINNFQPKTKEFAFVFDMNIPVYLFLDDSYYINRNTCNCEYTQRVDGLIFWYNNKSVHDSYSRVFPNKHITNINSRFVNTETFKDYGLEKKYDILLYGSRVYYYEYKREQIDDIQNYIKQYEQHNNVLVDNDTKLSFYPLRCKLHSIILRNQHKYNIHIVDEACYDSPVANAELSKLINQSHLTITCSSIANVLLHKYLEISASKSTILGDIPSDYYDLFKDNIIEVNKFMSDEHIEQIIDNALSNKHVLADKHEKLYHNIHTHHNLKKATESFTNVITSILEK